MAFSIIEELRPRAQHVLDLSSAIIDSSPLYSYSIDFNLAFLSSLSSEAV